MTPLIALSLALLAPPADALPVWTLSRWLDQSPARTHCMADGSLLAESFGRLRRLTPDGRDERLDALGVVGELRPLPDGWWLQRRGTTDSAEGQRLDAALKPIGAPFRIPAPAFDMMPCGPDRVIGWAGKPRERGPLSLWDRTGAVKATLTTAGAAWTPLICDGTGGRVYRVEGDDAVAHDITTDAVLWRSPLGVPPDGQPPHTLTLEPAALTVTLGNGRLLKLSLADGRRLAFSPAADEVGPTVKRSDGWWMGRHRFAHDSLDPTGSAPSAVCPLPGGRARFMRGDGTVVSGPLAPLLTDAPGIGHARTPGGISIHSDGALYSMDEDRRVIAWDTRGRPRWRFAGLASTLDRNRDLALTTDGQSLFALGAATVQRLRTRDGRPDGRWALDGARFAGQLRISRDGRRAAFTDGAGRIGVLALRPGAVPRYIKVGRDASGHDPAIDLSPDGRWLAVADRDRPLRIIDAESGAVRAKPTLPRASAVRFGPDGTFVALNRGESLRGIEIIGLADGRRWAAIADASADAFDFDTRGHWLAYGSWSHHLGLWCWHASCADRTPHPTDPPWHVSAVVMDPTADGVRYWSTGADQAIIGWGVDGREVRRMRAGRASRTHATPVATDAAALYMGLLDGSVLRIPWDGTAPTRFAPRTTRDAEGITWEPGEPSTIRVGPDGILAGMAHGMVQRWKPSGEAMPPLTPKTPGSPGIIAPMGSEWLFGAWDQLVAFGPDGQPRPTPATGGATGQVQRIVPHGERAAVQWEDGSSRRMQVRLLTRGSPASPALEADEIGPLWFEGDTLAVLHRSADPETDAEEGDVDPVWQLSRLDALGRWRAAPDADLELLPTLGGAPAARLADGRAVLGLDAGFAVVRGDRWITGYWIGPGARLASLAVHPTRPWVVAGDDDGGVHVFDLETGARRLHAFGYADGDWAVIRPGAVQAPPGGRHHPSGG